ncbi:MAG: S8 family peptidase [Dehalobacter sp. 4CP]|uniref:S8 family peptidase n=1 Tax=Dehalobacter sp. CP TaxID=2594474 RepID=UPI0013C7ADE8|nr:S8 family peptidase [Dehalobacter sp. 4CP]
MSDERDHLWIPKNQVREDIVNLGNGGPSYSRDDYYEHGKRLTEQVNKIKNEIIIKKDAELTKDYILQVKTPEQISIKSHKDKLNKLGFDIVSYSNNKENIATAIIHKDKFNEFDKKVIKYAESEDHYGKTNISVIEEIREVPLEEKIDTSIKSNDDIEVECIITLYNILSAKEKEIIINNIESVLRNKDINEIRKSKLLNGTVILSANLHPSIIKELGQEYITVRSISVNGSMILEKSFPTDNLPNPLVVSKPNTDVVVAVVDSGINETSPAFNGLINDNQLFLPSGTTKKAVDHGTLVASRVIYGDNLESCVHLHELTPTCSVIDITVFGEDLLGNVIGLKEDQLVTMLDNIVPTLSKTVRIFNLSLGFNCPIEDNKYSLLAQEIDFLSREFNVLFVIAAGNIRHPLASYPEHFKFTNARVQPPSESLLALTVGSIAKYSNASCLSTINEISPFSCIGPGADQGMKPELVAHGGNLLCGWGHSPRVGAYGVDSSGRRLAYDVGTSFSAPIISNYAAKILGANPNATMNLIKALLCNSANNVICPELDGIDPQKFYGFGEPDINYALSSLSTAVYIWQGSIKKDVYQYIKFHVPDSFAVVGAESKLRIRVTLVYNPPVNPDNQKEYSMSRMAVSLFKKCDDGMREVSLSSNDFKYSVPWNPVIQIEKDFSRNYCAGEWEARVRLLTRGDLPEDFQQDYVIIIQVIDANGLVDVYSDVLRSYSSIYLTVRIREAA